MSPKVLSAGILLLIASIEAACANELVLANASTGVNSDYGFVGSVLPLFGASIGSGPAIRIVGDYLEYHYTGGVGPVDASGLGAQLAAVYQFSGAWGWANVSAGGQFRDTHLSVFDPGNTERGSRTYYNFQADGGYNLDGAWRMTGLANYIPTIHGYFAQAGLDRSIMPSLRLGVGATLQGDQNYHQTSGGLTAFFQVLPNLELDPTVGVSHGGGDTAPFGAVTLVLTAN